MEPGNRGQNQNPQEEDPADIAETQHAPRKLLILLCLMVGAAGFEPATSTV